MYKPLTQNISDRLTKGFVILPTEGEITKIPKLPFKAFAQIDFRYSNNEAIQKDGQSIIEPFEQNLTHDSNYVMGFAVIRNISYMDEFAQSSRATMTRLRNKIAEVMAETVSRCGIPRNRGFRAVYVEREPVELYERPTQDVMKAVGLNPSVDNARDYSVVPFLMSTTVYFNNFRAKIGVGNSWNGPELVRGDIMRHLSGALNEIMTKANRRLTTPVTQDILLGVVVASPSHIASDAPFVGSLQDYANEVHPTSAPVAQSTQDDGGGTNGFAQAPVVGFD